ncbi:MAG: hypothetical protein A2W08_05785 [Candidatus Rokubacteria bacterium RBG_16_73_20]|nr:MAG: hypothetical protein A2050_13960 [Candidatus Rokubacteria bacterium GWA2_73_35]OGK89921.1 MAG: hypothetical protein A2W08_05785 [Candidatus Rokubacteria bacterium RBG_16_73_20]HBH03155.1 hypothetical protein [Candidatus Rokubacteria bacterium]
MHSSLLVRMVGWRGPRPPKTDSSVAPLVSCFTSMRPPFFRGAIGPAMPRRTPPTWATIRHQRMTKITPSVTFRVAPAASGPLIGSSRFPPELSRSSSGLGEPAVHESPEVRPSVLAATRVVRPQARVPARSSTDRWYIDYKILI